MNDRSAIEDLFEDLYGFRPKKEGRAYEMLAGAPPFQAEKPTALALMHMREEPPPLAVRNPQVPPQLERIVRKVLSKEPSARYRTADQLAHGLGEYRTLSEQMTGWQSAVPGHPSTVQIPIDYVTKPESRLISKAIPGWRVLTRKER